MLLFTRLQQRRRKKSVVYFVLSVLAFIVLFFQEPSKSLNRLLSPSPWQEQVDLTKFQIDTYQLIDTAMPKDEIIEKLKEMYGVESDDNVDFDEASIPISIDQIFYINHDDDIDKRQKMEEWLSWFLPNLGIPFHRVPLLKGLPYVCAFKDEKKCIMESGMVDTILHLLQSKEYKMKGVSLVVQDDFEITNMHKLRVAAHLVPDDWDVIRFDCPLESNNDLPNLNNYVFQTNQGRDIRPFRDRSRVMLLRDDKFDKIVNAINVLPRQEFDAAISYKKIKSYCVNVGIGHRFEIIKPRPLIYTFYSPLHDEDQHDELIDVWRQEWEFAGFEPRILTIEDAKKNAFFETMRAEVEKVFSTDVYNAYCFYRYLAMANVGGIMTDYDTMPIHFPIEEVTSNELVNDGKFTSYQAHVPSLISASKEEWQRVAELLTNQISKSASWLKSDMLLLMELGQDPSIDVDFSLASGRRSVFNVIPYVKGEKQKVNCEFLKEMRAIHMSHSLTQRVKDAADELGFQPEPKRADFVQTFMNDFREQCLGVGDVVEIQ